MKPANYLPQHFSTHETPLNNFPTGNLDSTKSDAKTHLPSKLSELARLGKEALEQEQIFGEKKSKLYAENHDQYKGRTDASDRLKKSIDSYD